MERLITIVTICRNNKNELKRTLESYQQYLGLDVEAIIIDGSDNNTECFELSKNYNVDYYSQTGKGIYSAMNEGVQRSSGRSIIFMNSGDRFYSDFDLTKFKKMYEQYLSNKILFGDAVHTYKRFRKVYIYNKDNNLGLDWFPSHQSVFMPREFLLSNLFDVNYKISADTNLQRKAFSLYDYIYLNEIVCEFELGGVSSKPSSIRSIMKHSNEVFLARGVTSKIYKIKFIVKQFLKLLIIKMIGYECYLKVLN